MFIANNVHFIWEINWEKKHKSKDGKKNKK